jgi:hypothetical protein
MPQISLVVAITAATLLLHPQAVAVKPEIRSTHSQNMLSLAETIVAGVYQAPNQFLLPVNLPQRGEQQFSKLSFSFTEAEQDRVAVIPFNLSNVKAFLGTTDRSGDQIGIKTAWIDETGTLWVEFTQPVRSGTHLTVALNTQQHPVGTNIRYGIAAYPATRNPVPVFAGDGTLTSR